MQICYNISVKLSDYQAKVFSGQWNFPVFTQSCPICGGKNCAIRHGYYDRWAYSFKEQRWIEVPIARYICRRKGKPDSPTSHRTFSLLPSCLSAYQQYDIYCLLSAAALIVQKQLSFFQAAQRLSEQMADDSFNFEAVNVARCTALFQTACLKLQYFNKELNVPDDLFALNKLISQDDLPLYLSGFFEKTGRFLFGTPSQHRGRTAPGKPQPGIFR